MYISTVSQKLKKIEAVIIIYSDFNNGIKYCSSKYIFNCACLNVTVLKIDRNFNPVASIKYQSDWDADRYKSEAPRAFQLILNGQSSHIRTY